MKKLIILAALSLALMTGAMAEETAAKVMVPKPAPRAFFKNLKDGDTVKSPFKVEFGAEGIEIVPAGTDTPGTGHFHLLVDTEMKADETVIPKDDQHLHFGKGQTETDLTLPAGKHTLQIVIGDGNHLLLTPSVASDKITVTVE